MQIISDLYNHFIIIWGVEVDLYISIVLQKMQMQEQIALETAMAEIAGLKAKAENLMAQAQLNANKAAELEGANKVEEQIRNLQTQLALAQENLDKRFEMSRAGHMNAQVQNQRNNAVKLTTAAMQLKQRAQEAKKPLSFSY